jgi:hypothetical protein
MARTDVLKMLEEMYWYAVGEESTGQHFATLIVTGATGVTIRERDAYSSGYTGDLLIIPKYGIGWGNTGPTVTAATGTANDAAFSAGDPPNAAKKVTVTGGAATYFTVASGTAGEVFEVYRLPSYSSSNEVDWITSVSGNPSPGKRNVYLRGSLNHRKRVFAQDKSLSIGLNYTNATSELLKYAGNPFTLIGERQDDDAGVTTESVVIFGCFFEWGFPNESLGDTDTELSVDVMYADIAWIDGDVGA